MDSFVWDKHFETGLPVIDEQHRTLVDLINQFGQSLENAEVPDVHDLAPVIDRLTAYAAFHFKEEEAYMDLEGVDPRHVVPHRAAHADFCQEMVRMSQEMANSNRAEAEHLLKFLIHWLAYHILGTDQAMASQIGAIHNGQSPDDAFLTQARFPEGAMEPILRALNGLFHQVSDRNRELIELTRTLEAKVAERTKALELANQQLAELALTDALTGLPNRRHAISKLERECANLVGTGKPLSVMMIDADGLKTVNDTYGHDAGDEVLRQLSSRLSESVRNDDVVCRLGGDEFLVICPSTPLLGAIQVAENLRRLVAEMRVTAGLGVWCGSISIGLTDNSKHGNNWEALIRAADERLYEAKRSGRNRVSWPVGQGAGGMDTQMPHAKIT